MFINNLCKVPILGVLEDFYKVYIKVNNVKLKFLFTQMARL